MVLKVSDVRSSTVATAVLISPLRETFTFYLSLPAGTAYIATSSAFAPVGSHSPVCHSKTDIVICFGKMHPSGPASVATILPGALSIGGPNVGYAPGTAASSVVPGGASAL